MGSREVRILTSKRANGARMSKKEYRTTMRGENAKAVEEYVGALLQQRNSGK